MRVAMSSVRPVHIAGAVAFMMIFSALAWRLTETIDLTDESYYAAFIDDWLKGGIATSTLTTVHQTAALIVYPAAIGYSAVVGSSDGMILFLRVVYLLGSAVASIVWLGFLLKLGTPVTWAGALICLVFVPFGLAAPSYNTLGLQGLVVAIAAFGRAALALSDGGATCEARRWFVVSAATAAVATVAYPTLALPIGMLVLLAPTLRGMSFANVRFFAILVVAVQAAAWATIVLTLSWRKLYDSVLYFAAFGDTGGLARKLDYALAIFIRLPTFSALLVCAAILGIFRQWMGQLWTATVTGVLVVALFALPPALVIRSHDAVTIIALTGLGLLSGFNKNASGSTRLLAVLYAASLIAAITTALTATLGIFNFCIGGLPAALLALAGNALPEIETKKRVGCIRQVSLAGHAAGLTLIGWTSMTYFYGRMPSAEVRHRINWGVFSGISTDATQAALLNIMRDFVTPLVNPENTIYLVGRIPGLLLATPARPLALMVSPLVPSIGVRGPKLSHDFYQDLSHRPRVVVVYIDPYFEAVNPFGEDFASWYNLVYDYRVPPGILRVFRRHDANH
jgi:hypothetical protein